MGNNETEGLIAIDHPVGLRQRFGRGRVAPLTLLAVVGYFRRDLVPLATGAVRWVGGDRQDSYGRLAVNLLLGTIPVGLVGLFGKDFIETALRSPSVVAFQLAVFGIVLYLVDRLTSSHRDERSLSIRDALVIGCAQALALVPGTSRSGITMTAGRALGLSREAAARFAFLLSVPGIARQPPEINAAHRQTP